MDCGGVHHERAFLGLRVASVQLTTAVQRLKAENLAAGGLECLRCDAGWYQYEEVTDLLRCSICGYVEYVADRRNVVSQILAHQEWERRNLKRYLKGQKLDPRK